MTADRLRLAWFAACCFVVIFGFGEFGSWVVQAFGPEGWWGIDLRLILDAGARQAEGSALYSDPRFLYPPLAAVVGRVLGPVPFDGLSVLYAVLKVAVAFAAIWSLTAAWRPGWRLLAAVTLIGSLPFVHDVMLGNANVLLVGAMLPAVFGTPRVRNGILLGLAVAIFAKPLVVPVLLWLLVWRPLVAAGSVAAGLAATAVGIALTGLPSYLAWSAALAGGTRFAAPFEGNHGVTALVPELWLPVAIVTAAGLVAVLLLRGPAAGLVWAVAAGILISPYAGTYSALPLALALPVLAPQAPLLTLALVAASPIATTHPLPLYAAVFLIAGLTLRDDGLEARPWLRAASHRAESVPAPRWPALSLDRTR